MDKGNDSAKEDPGVTHWTEQEYTRYYGVLYEPS